MVGGAYSVTVCNRETSVTESFETSHALAVAVNQELWERYRHGERGSTSL